MGEERATGGGRGGAGEPQGPPQPRRRACWQSPRVGAGGLKGPLGSSSPPNVGKGAFVMSRISTDHISPTQVEGPPSHHPAQQAERPFPQAPAEPLQLQGHGPRTGPPRGQHPLVLGTEAENSLPHRPAPLRPCSQPRSPFSRPAAGRADLGHPPGLIHGETAGSQPRPPSPLQSRRP